MEMFKVAIKKQAPDTQSVLMKVLFTGLFSIFVSEKSHIQVP
jgi:hypothetical protein